MNLREPYRYSNINLDNIMYSKTKQLNQKRIIYIKYNDSNNMNQLVFQCPTLYNSMKPQKVSDEYYDLEMPIITQDKNKQDSFINFLENLDNKITKDSTTNNWLVDTNDMKYKKILRDSDTNSKVLKLKIIKSKDFETIIQSDSNRKLNPRDINTNIWCKILLEVYAVVVNMKTNVYNVLLRPIILSFKEKQEYNYSVIDESDNEDDNVLDTEVNNIFLKQSDNNLQTSSNNVDILSSVIQPRVSNNIQANNMQLNNMQANNEHRRMFEQLHMHDNYTSSSSDKLVLSDTTTSDC
jgi:hypothetical protein